MARPKRSHMPLFNVAKCDGIILSKDNVPMQIYYGSWYGKTKGGAYWVCINHVKEDVLKNGLRITMICKSGKHWKNYTLTPDNHLYKEIMSKVNDKDFYVPFYTIEEREKIVARENRKKREQELENKAILEVAKTAHNDAVVNKKCHVIKDGSKYAQNLKIQKHTNDGNIAEQAYTRCDHENKKFNRGYIPTKKYLRLA